MVFKIINLLNFFYYLFIIFHILHLQNYFHIFRFQDLFIKINKVLTYNHYIFLRIHKKVFINYITREFFLVYQFLFY